MVTRTLQTKVAKSRWTLSTLATLALMVWGVAGAGNHRLWVTMLCLTLSTYLMVELNNANALIRIYSRMVSGAFLVLTTVCMHQLADYGASIAILCMAGFYTSLFRAYQDQSAPGWVFYAFVCWGFASVVWVQALSFLPLFWLLMGVTLRAWSARNFCASLLGLALPYGVLAAVLIVRDELPRLLPHFSRLAQYSMPFDYATLSIRQIVSLAFVLFCAFIGSVHFLRQSHNDNIRTRQYFYSFIIVDAVVFLCLCLQPQHYEALLAMMIVNTSPLIGHFLALTHTKLTNMMFLFLSMASLLLVVYNLWQSFPTF